MTTATEKLPHLIRELAVRMSSRPGAITVDAAANARSGGTVLTMRCHLEDERVLVGSGGTHVRAFAFIVERIGLARGLEFLFELKTTGAPSDGILGASYAERHDAGPDRELLAGLMEALNVEVARVVVTVDESSEILEYTFSITPRAHEGCVKLLAQNGRGIPLIGAIGTLFRAIAKKAGVRYVLDVLEP